MVADVKRSPDDQGIVDRRFNFGVVEGPGMKIAVSVCVGLR